MTSRDRHDMVELGGRTARLSAARSNGHEIGDGQRPPTGNRFLSVWFRCCHVYGRMTRNAAQTAYEGRCPKCGAKVSAGIGPRGTSRRVFEAM